MSGSRSRSSTTLGRENPAPALRVNLFPVDVLLADGEELFHLAPGTALTHWHFGHSGLQPFQLWNRGAGSWDLGSTGDHLQTHTWRV